MKFRLPAQRLLQATIFAIGALLVFKSVAIVRAAAPAAAPAEAPAGKPPAPKPAATVEAKPGADAKPGATKPGDAKPGDAKPGDAKPGDAVAQGAPPPPAISDAERGLLVDLRQRRVELEARAAGLAARENMLASAEKRLSGRLDELAALQSRLEALETARKQRDEANWSGLVKLYEGMKPRDAATIFNDLDPAVLLQVLDRMKEGKAGAVLAAMQPERARQVTAQLAQMRNKGNAAPGPAPASAKTGT